MLGVVLGFSGRVGRLRFFLFSTGLTAAAVAVTVGIAVGLARNGASGIDAAKSRTGLLSLATVFIPYVWLSLALQAKRIRDIGWRPDLVIPAWVAALFIDRLLVQTGTLQAFRGQMTSPLGALLNLAAVGILLFWPGRDADPARRTEPSPGAAPPAPAPAPDPSAAAAVSFGRRGAR